MKHRHKFRPAIVNGERLGISEMKHRQFIMRQIINSKGAVCALCGEPIENKKECTIDHIIPVSKGGVTSIENCQLAHDKCNWKKGNKL